MNDLMQTLWIGKSLSKMERLSLTSFVAAGHPVRLFAYEPIDGLPAAVELVDAREIMPQGDIFTYRNGSLAAFANVFRYKLLLERGGWWVDADCVCLKPFHFDREHILGWQDHHEVNNAVIRAPAGSTLMDRAFKISTELGQNIRPGETGPWLLTRLVREMGMEACVKPREVFYPLAYSRAQMLLRPGGPLPPAESYCLHLWHEIWRRHGFDKNADPPRDSVYGKLLTRFGI